MFEYSSFKRLFSALLSFQLTKCFLSRAHLIGKTSIFKPPLQEKKKTPLPPQVQSDMYNTFVPYSGPRIKTPSSSCYPLLPLNFFEIDSGPSSKPCANHRSLHHRFFDVTWIRFILLALHALLSLFVTYRGGLSCP